MISSTICSLDFALNEMTAAWQLADLPFLSIFIINSFKSTIFQCLIGNTSFLHHMQKTLADFNSQTSSKRKGKEADLHSAFIEVPHNQGAQVRITQCYLQITPYLPLPRKHSPDGASQTEVADI